MDVQMNFPITLKVYFKQNFNVYILKQHSFFDHHNFIFDETVKDKILIKVFKQQGEDENKIVQQQQSKE
jgi:hypothetical protein